MVDRFRTFGRSVVHFAPHDRAHWVAIRTTAVLGCALLLLWYLDHLEWALFAAFGGFCAVYGRHQSYPDRFRVQLQTGGLLVAATTSGTAVGVIAPGSLLAVLLMAVASGVGYVLSRRHGWLPPGSLFFVFAAGATSAFRHPISAILIALIISAIVALAAVALGQAGRFTTSGRRRSSRAPSAVLSWRELMETPGVRRGALVQVAGPLVAGGAATLIGVGHPYWAAVAATVPLAGQNLTAGLTRGVQRLVGTVIGVLFTVAVLTLAPPTVLVILIVVLLQGMIELVVLRNYGVAVIAITPLALLLSHLGGPDSPLTLAVDRVAETAVGVLVAIAVLLVSTLIRGRSSKPQKGVA